MNCADLFDYLQKVPFGEKQYQETHLHLSQIVNASFSNIQTILSSDTYYARFIVAALISDENLLKYCDKIEDSQKPTLLSHAFLMRLSYLSEAKPDMVNAITRTILTNSKHFENTGSTLGYALGYNVGKHIYLGNDISILTYLTTNKFITEKDRFFEGLQAGYANQEDGLGHNQSYVTSIIDRYEKWNSSARKTALNLMAYSHFSKNSKLPKNLNPINEKVLWFLRGYKPKSTFVLDLINTHPVHNILVKEVIKEVPKEVLVEVPASPIYSSVVELSNTVNAIKQKLLLELELSTQRLEKMNEEVPLKPYKL